MKIIVHAKPRAWETSVEMIDETSCVVSVPEPPVDGKANRAIAAALAQHFGVAKSRVVMKSGFTARVKVFEILGK